MIYVIYDVIAGEYLTKSDFENLTRYSVRHDEGFSKEASDARFFNTISEAYSALSNLMDCKEDDDLGRFQVKTITIEMAKERYMDMDMNNAYYNEILLNRIEELERKNTTLYDGISMRNKMILELRKECKKWKNLYKNAISTEEDEK